MPEISEEELTKFKATEERAGQLEASKRRLEEESGKFKTRAQEAEEKLSLAEKAKLESEGNIQALLDKERGEHQALLGKFKTRTSDVLKEKLRTEIMKHAKDAHNVDRILSVTEHKDLLKLDEEALTITGAKEFVEKVRETDSYLFTKKNLEDTENTPPGTGDQTTPKTEEEKYLVELRACTTKQQLADVRKKYGKNVD